MKNILISILIALCIGNCLSTIQAQNNILLQSKNLEITLNEKGYYQSIRIVDKEVMKKESSPILTACNDKQLITPIQLTKNQDKLQVTMSDHSIVELAYTETPHCITLEAHKVPSHYEAIIFGPICIQIHEQVGDIVGVVQGNGIAMGMQSMNTKTTAGVPEEYAEQMQTYFKIKGKETELSVGTIPIHRLAAVYLTDGAAFQLFCRNRSQAERRTIFQLKDMQIEPVKGENAHIKGAKIAIWGASQSEALTRIAAIEQEQGLPHPLFDGEWGKTSRAAMKSYLISNFGEKDFDFILDKAEKAGFKYIYHSDPFEEWGHFRWNKKFVEGGDEKVAALVKKAAQRGIAMGIHTLTNFTTTNDAYVTPIPSTHLLKQGALQLTSGIDDKQTEIRIQKSNYFELPMTLNGLMIDQELITYGEVKQEGETMLLTGCTRGAFGTTAATHTKETPLYKLWDYPYKTFFPDLELQDAYADRLIEIFNKTGLKQISFDGLEGCMYTGHEDYSTSHFVKRFYQGVKHNVLNDASRLNHFNWHIHTRMNWGEPWGEAMRTGQVENRIKNQKFFQRNLFPRMLGWFLIRLDDRKFEATTLEDLEWALSESAGFDAGYAMSINVRTLKNHGQIDQLLTAIKHWDMLREKQCFTPEQMEELKKVETEWHLEKKNEKEFLLYPLNITKYFHCALSEMQPGQTGGSDWVVNTPHGGKYAFRLKVEGDGAIENPKFQTPKGTIVFPCTLETDQYLLYTYEGKATVTDKNYRVITDVTPQGVAEMPTGDSHVIFSCEPIDDTTPDIQVRFITRGKPQTIVLK